MARTHVKKRRQVAVVLQLLATSVEKGQTRSDPDLRAIVDECVKVKSELRTGSDYRFLNEHLQMMGQNKVRELSPTGREQIRPELRAPICALP